MNSFTRGTTAYFLESWQNALRILQAMTPHEREYHFNMSFWGKKTDCGTVACLAGHCALDSWFQKERGLKPLWSQEDEDGQGPFMWLPGVYLGDIFGGKHSKIFWQYEKTHADVVRKVERIVAELSGVPINPRGWGIP